MAKKILIVILLFLLCIVLNLLSDSIKEDINITNDDIYYVKYVSDYEEGSSKRYTLTYTDWNLKTYSTYLTGYNELICGPFKFNDTIKASIDIEYEYSLNEEGMKYLRIYISKNNEPFVIRELINNEYTINF